MGAKRARLGWNAGKGGEVTYVDAAPSGTLYMQLRVRPILFDYLRKENKTGESQRESEVGESACVGGCLCVTVCGCLCVSVCVCV